MADEIQRSVWEDEYKRRVEKRENLEIVHRFALTPKERFEVEQIIREQLRDAYLEVFFEEEVGGG